MSIEATYELIQQQEIERRTDKYFTNVRHIVNKFGDSEVTYAVFIRRKVVAALQPMIAEIQHFYPKAKITRFWEEGDLVPAEAKLVEITGSYKRLSELETLWLQKTGLPCVAAYNAYMMTLALPNASFMDMHARHGFGDDMSKLAAYGAVVGSRAAQAQNASVRGFVGTSQQLTAEYFGVEEAMGTTPHALIGYAGGDIVRAMDMFARACPDQKAMIALVDYDGHEVTDSLRAADWYRRRRQRYGWADKFFGVRLDTHGGRFAEGLDYDTSVKILERWTGVKGEYNIVAQVLGEHAFNMDTENQLVDKVRKVLFGKGVSAANIINVRNQLDKGGHYGALVVASSGFDPFKCEVMGAIDAPINMVGTGSFLPKTLSETFATADVVSYDGVPRVKVGREYLLEDEDRE